MDYMYGSGRHHLFVPGPTNIPEPVMRALNRNNEDYRSPAIPALTKILLEDVKKIFKTTTGTPFLFPTTGTIVAFNVLYLTRCIVFFIVFMFRYLVYVQSIYHGCAHSRSISSNSNHRIVCNLSSKAGENFCPAARPWKMLTLI